MRKRRRKKKEKLEQSHRLSRVSYGSSRLSHLPHFGYGPAVKLNNAKNMAVQRERRERFRGGASKDVDLANNLLALGIDLFMGSHGEILASVPAKCEGRLVKNLSQAALTFLKDNYDVEFYKDVAGEQRLHFNSQSRKDKLMGFYSDVAERCEQPRKIVQKVYEGLLEEVRSQLRHERRAKLPDLGILKVKYRKARPARKGKNPFDGKEMMFKAKPASNKLRFSIAKKLKEYVNEKISIKKK